MRRRPLAGRDRLDRAGADSQDFSWLLPLVGLFLLMPPLLNLFDRPLFLFGIPLLLIYLFAIWLVGILLTAWVARRLGQGTGIADEDR